jgi:hypothetical protein
MSTRLGDGKLCAKCIAEEISDSTEEFFHRKQIYRGDNYFSLALVKKVLNRFCCVLNEDLLQLVYLTCPA